MSKRQKNNRGMPTKKAEHALYTMKEQVYSLMQSETNPDKLVELCALNNTVFDLFVLHMEAQASSPSPSPLPSPQTPKRKVKRKRVSKSESKPAASPQKGLFSDTQMCILKQVFHDTPYPSNDKIQELVDEFAGSGITFAQIKNKFGNMRHTAKQRRSSRTH